MIKNNFFIFFDINNKMKCCFKILKLQKEQQRKRNSFWREDLNEQNTRLNRVRDRVCKKDESLKQRK